MPPAAPHERREGERFGKYTLVDRLAVGGMAELFLAHRSDAEAGAKAVVIKRILPHLSGQPGCVRMFLDEARLGAQLNHPNVVQIDELGKVGDSYFIAMEYVSGRDMRQVLARASALGIPFPVVYALKIASSVCEALSYAHQLRDAHGTLLHIVHRDITPENILVSFDGTVKLLDFGVARSASRVEQLQSGVMTGRLGYMSPEQCLGQTLDGRSDVFSLGVVLYEWLTGFRLFNADSDVGVLQSITGGRVHPPSYFRADIPEPVEALVMRALERDRDHRHATAAELQTDIDRCLGQVRITPSALHIANYLGQLFREEREAERARLAGWGEDR